MFEAVGAPRSVACGKDSTCVQNAPKSLVEVYAKQALTSSSNTAEIRETLKASKAFAEKIAALMSRRRVDS